jgi:FMN reductase
MLERLAARGVDTTLIDLAALPADALLGRAQAEQVTAALQAVANAQIVLASTPIYRATYSGLLKVFFDLLPPDGLVRKVGVPIAAGAAPGHQLALDHGLRPLFASVGAVVGRMAVFATERQFQDGVPEASLVERLDQAAVEALALAATVASP